MIAVVLTRVVWAGGGLGDGLGFRVEFRLKPEDMLARLWQEDEGLLCGGDPKRGRV